MKLRLLQFIVVVFVAVAIGCGSSTSITSVWRNPEAGKKTYKNICVIAITPNATNKLVAETEVTKQFTIKKVKSDKLSDVFPYQFTGNEKEKDWILEKVRANGNDGILTFALVKKKQETNYVPGTSTYYGGMGYGSFGGYYGGYGYQTYSPGYYTSSEVYVVETNLYDTQTEKLVWTAQSKTYDPDGIQVFAQEVSRAIIYKLLTGKVVEPTLQK